MEKIYHNRAILKSFSFSPAQQFRVTLNPASGLTRTPNPPACI
jgi:hypothetical protein